MLSIPPATTSSASPARISAAASMIDFRPEPQTRLIVVAEVVSASPPASAAWRAGAWPAPPCRTWPLRTSSSGGPSGRPERSSAARIATPPSVVAGTSASPPANLPIGVRAALTRKTCPFRPPACSTISVTLDPSAGPREAEVDLRGARIRPALGDDLRPRVELDPLGTVHVQVPEERALPAAEAVIRDGHRDGNVDPDHPGVHLELELAGRAAVASEDRGPIAVRVVVDQPDRGLVCRHADDGQNRPEDLVLVRIHVGRDAVDQRDAEEETVGLLVERVLTAVGHDRRALGRRAVEIGRDLVAVLTRDE